MKVRLSGSEVRRVAVTFAPRDLALATNTSCRNFF